MPEKLVTGAPAEGSSCAFLQLPSKWKVTSAGYVNIADNARLSTGAARVITTIPPNTWIGPMVFSL